MVKRFSAGCGVVIYKRELIDKLKKLLDDSFDHDIIFDETCCRVIADGSDTPNTHFLNSCPGCDWRFAREHKGATTESLWEYLKDKELSLPDYKGLKVALHDACPVRGRPSVHEAVRDILKRMNIEVIDIPQNKSKSVCCGSSILPKVSPEKLEEHIHRRVAQLTKSSGVENIVVYCVSCFNRFASVGAKPIHILDLLLNEEPDYSNIGQDFTDELSAYIKRLRQKQMSPK